MSSDILAIYDALAATSITVNGVAVAVKDADELPNTVSAATLPIRLLTPLNPLGVEVGATGEQIAKAGGSMPFVVQWTIADILLWQPLATNVGVRAHAKELLAYCVEYLDMLKTVDINMITSVSLVPDAINYPVQSDNWYYGVRSIVGIKEDFT